MILRIIHQTWRTYEVPECYRDWQASWQRLNPGYAYRLWTNGDIERLIAEDFPQWAPLFNSYAKNICRIDLARYLILKKHGGIYADLDHECLRPQDPLLRHRRCKHQPRRWSPASRSAVASRARCAVRSRISGDRPGSMRNC